MHGEDVELDRSIIDGLSDPLNHIIRNSSDHGLEEPDEREMNGKPRAGTITLSASHEAGHVVITAEDDGRVIDAAKIKQKALDKGVITAEEAAAMTDKEAVKLIFHPGFSTAEKVSDISGRGVGMDVVRSTFEKLGGTVDFETELGKGSKVIVRLPLTLAIVPSHLVGVEDCRFAIPQVDLVEVVRLKRGDRRKTEWIARKMRLIVSGSVLDLFSLFECLKAVSGDGGIVDLSKYLEKKRKTVNAALERLVPAEDQYPARLHRAMRYSLLAGGKRLRPVLVLATAEAVGGRVSDALNTACALECIHTYSLIHDDLPCMDDDDMRRGKPTCHKEFDEATAVLAGDGLLTLAFKFLAESAFSGADRSALLRVVFEVAHGAGPAGMVGGQMVDIESEGKEITFPDLENIHIRKTGALIRASVRAGAIIGGANTDDLKALTRYAESIGLAFQIADDILDVEGSSNLAGKRLGADAKKDKATYPALIGLTESKERAKELVARALSSLDRFDERADPLREIARYIIARDH